MKNLNSPPTPAMPARLARAVGRLRVARRRAWLARPRVGARLAGSFALCLLLLATLCSRLVPSVDASSAALAVPGARAIPAGGRVPWQGKDWYLHGANVPWLNWGADFGGGVNGGGVSSAASRTELARGFGQLRDAGVHTVRWWTFEGDAGQVRRDAAGAPAGLDPAVYADFDAALELAETYDLYYTFVLFSGPSSLPSSWLDDPSQRAKLAGALAPLFARYRDNPRLMTWEVFNEPDFEVWNGGISEASLRATVQAVAEAVHANSSAYVTVGMGFLDGLPMVVGTGLDYYQAHWYDYMAGGDYCARCRHYASIKAQYNLDAPLVIGELYAGLDVDALDRLEDFYAKGYAGAWPWSVFPERTNDRMAIDWSAMRAFSGRHADLGPRTGSALPPSQPTPAVPLRFTTSATVDRARVAPGETLTATLTVTSNAPVAALVDVEVYGPAGRVATQVFDDQAFVAGQARTYTLRWPVTATTVAGDHVVKIRVFGPGWGGLHDWNDVAATFSVVTVATVPVGPRPVCSPRPPVTVATAAIGPGQLRVTVSVAGADNLLREVRFGAPRNVSIDVPNLVSGARDAFTSRLTSAETSLTFDIRRTAQGVATVPLAVVDGCGTWEAFVGGGHTAF